MFWHFKVADDLIDSIVVRQIWGIPKGSDVRFEADKVAMYNSSDILLVYGLLHGIYFQVLWIMTIQELLWLLTPKLLLTAIDVLINRN